MGEEGEKPFAEPSKGEMLQGYWRTWVGCRIRSRPVMAGVPVRSNPSELLANQP